MEHQGTIRCCQRQVLDGHDDFQPSIEEGHEEEEETVITGLRTKTFFYTVSLNTRDRHRPIIDLPRGECT